MIFNRWRKYPKRKPKNEGQYQCIVKFGFGGQIEKPTVLDLFWLYVPDRGGVWIDKSISKIYWGAEKNNGASITLAKKLGLVHDYDTDYYTIYKKEKQ